MFVCICSAVREETLASLADEGLSFEEIQAVTGCSATCGSCLEHARSLVHSRALPHFAVPTLPLHAPA